MRDIKFDMIIKNNHTGCLHHKKYSLRQLMTGIENLFDIENYTSVADRQYTGLKDKNGVEIYEGDILDEKYKVQVYFKDGQFKIKSNLDGFVPRKLIRFLNLRDKAGIHCEVIGNIYENENLLENPQ